MRRVILPALALGLVAVPMALPAQEAAPRTELRQARPLHAGNPAGRVLAVREQLGLTAAQVAQLEQLCAFRGAEQAAAGAARGGAAGGWTGSDGGAGAATGRRRDDAGAARADA